MAAAREYVRTYQDQAHANGEDSLGLLVEFLISYGLIDATVTALCQLIDEEGIAPDFGRHLREDGLMIDGGVDSADGVDLDGEDDLADGD